MVRKRRGGKLVALAEVLGLGDWEGRCAVRKGGDECE